MHKPAERFERTKLKGGCDCRRKTLRKTKLGGHCGTDRGHQHAATHFSKELAAVSEGSPRFRRSQFWGHAYHATPTREKRQPHTAGREGRKGEPRNLPAHA